MQDLQDASDAITYSYMTRSPQGDAVPHLSDHEIPADRFMGRYDADKDYQTGDYVLCTAGRVHRMITAPKPDKKVAPGDGDMWKDMGALGFKD